MYVKIHFSKAMYIKKQRSGQICIHNENQSNTILEKRKVQPNFILVPNKTRAKSICRIINWNRLKHKSLQFSIFEFSIPRWMTKNGEKVPLFKDKRERSQKSR